jgi:mxaJ protein
MQPGVVRKLGLVRKPGLVVGLFATLAITANTSFAENEIGLDLNSGRGGEAQRVDDGTEFRVCADQDLMPMSNSKQEGFENKIAEVLAKDLGKKLSYQFWYDRQGFLRNTLNAKRCDVVMGTAQDNDALRTSKPYYRSGNIFVWRKDSNYNITNWDSPDLKKGFIGIVGQSPATIPMNDHDLIGNARPYRQQRDLNIPPSYLIDDLAKKEIDIAVVWGPIGGYFAKNSKVPMEVRLIPEYENSNPIQRAKGKQYWNISIGVRKKDKERMDMINAALERNKDKIEKILDEYGVPHVPVMEDDSIVKMTHEKSEAARGAIMPKSE